MSAIKNYRYNGASISSACGVFNSDNPDATKEFAHEASKAVTSARYAASSSAPKFDDGMNSGPY